jgi:hypothetical protein
MLFNELKIRKLKCDDNILVNFFDKNLLIARYVQGMGGGRTARSMDRFPGSLTILLMVTTEWNAGEYDVG